MTNPPILVLSPRETYFAWNIFHALRDESYEAIKAKTIDDFLKTGHSLDDISLVIGERPTDSDLILLDRQRQHRVLFRYILCDESDPGLEPGEKFFTRDSDQSCYCLSKDPYQFVQLIREGW